MIWYYQNMTMHGCATTPDRPEPWCIVTNPQDCTGGSLSAADPTVVEDTCGSGSVVPTTTPLASTTGCIGCTTVHGCICLKTWYYQGNEMHGCMITADRPDPWCVVLNPEDCTGGTPSASDPSVIEDVCGDGAASTTPSPTTSTYEELTHHGCVCLKTWFYANQTMHGCSTTDDHDEPWCIVQNPEDCTQGAAHSPADPSMVEDTCGSQPCTGPECATEHGCICLKTWYHSGQDHLM